jgi:acetyl-CoA carboxylase biotin carboxyl carrier protein
VGKEILTYDDLLQIVELIKSAEAFSEFHLKIGDIELDLRKSRPGVSNPSAASIASHAAAPLPAPVEAPSVDAVRIQNEFPEPAPYLAELPSDIAAGSVVIKSPMVGTFYRSPEPGAKAFVEVGQAVSAETTVCIIEVMKLMNSLPAGTQGRVTHVLVDDAQPVDMGQALIIIDPNG